MGNEITVYQKMISSHDALSAVVRNEIGIKSCIPFSAKACDALASLGNLTEQEGRKAANTFLSNLQTLTQGGITTEDYDMIDFVKRGKEICISARVEAFIRAAARKGYRIIDTIVAVPKADAATTYFKENFYLGDIIYTLEDLRKNGDRKITAGRLISNYFDKFVCRMEISNINANKRLLMTIGEISNEEVLAAAAASDNGIFKSKWETYKDEWGNQRKRKVITSETNVGSIWNVWTAAMVRKTVIRRALKSVKETLPELKEAIFAFETDIAPKEEQQNETQTKEVEFVAITPAKVNIFELTEEQKAEADEMLELYSANPKMATVQAEEIKALFENGTDIQVICNDYYAAIVNLAKGKTTYPIIKDFLEAMKAADDNETD